MAFHLCRQHVIGHPPFEGLAFPDPCLHLASAYHSQYGPLKMSAGTSGGSGPLAGLGAFTYTISIRSFKLSVRPASSSCCLNMSPLVLYTMS